MSRTLDMEVMMESVTFSFTAIVTGRLTVHKNQLPNGMRLVEDAQVIVKDTISVMARTGEGPLVFEKVEAQNITFEETV